MIDEDQNRIVVPNISGPGSMVSMMPYQSVDKFLVFCWKIWLPNANICSFTGVVQQEIEPWGAKVIATYSDRVDKIVFAHYSSYVEFCLAWS